MRKFSKSFTEQTKLPSEALEAAQNVLCSANLHRYQSIGSDGYEVAKLEEEFASWQGVKYCLAVTSGGQALQLAARAVGVKPGDTVLTNAFTLAPVPGALFAVGANPVLVETTPDLVIDLDDLKLKAQQTKARFLVVSHMRGHLVDMDKLMQLADDLSLIVIEDCAHTMGANWGDEKSGNFGLVSCFSTQTYKHLNSGEGGLLTSNDPEVMARAIIMSGSYMNYDRHGAAPGLKYFKDVKFDFPNMSARMDALRASILRPQLRELDANILNWNSLAKAFEGAICKVSNRIVLPKAADGAQRVGSSVQFRIPSFDERQCIEFLKLTKNLGLEIKWFGANEPIGYTSSHNHWAYIEAHELKQTDEVLSTLFDMRMPLTFNDDDCCVLALIIGATLTEILASEGA